MKNVHVQDRRIISGMDLYIFGKARYITDAMIEGSAFTTQARIYMHVLLLNIEKMFVTVR